VDGLAGTKAGCVAGKKRPALWTEVSVGWKRRLTASASTRVRGFAASAGRVDAGRESLGP